MAHVISKAFVDTSRKMVFTMQCLTAMFHNALLSRLFLHLLYQEDEMKKGELEADTDRMMREYRAQLDAERARKLAHGRNHSSKSNQ